MDLLCYNCQTSFLELMALDENGALCKCRHCGRMNQIHLEINSQELDNMEIKPTDRKAGYLG